MLLEKVSGEGETTRKTNIEYTKKNQGTTNNVILPDTLTVFSFVPVVLTMDFVLYL